MPGKRSPSTAIKKKVASKPAHAPAKQGGKPVRAATAAAILGILSGGKGKPEFRPNGANIKPQWMRFYKILTELRDRLLLQMNGLAKESAEQMPGYSLHMADSGTDNFDRDFALSLLSSDQDAIFEIEEALKRIERGTYGVCELTNKSIPKDRLMAIPWTRYTVDAQAQLERDGIVRHKRLGTLGTVDSSGATEVEEDHGEEDEKPAKEK